jgi:hypothetical protein
MNNRDFDMLIKSSIIIVIMITMSFVAMYSSELINIIR